VNARIPFPEHAWPLLRKALEHIAAHPDEFYMREFRVRRDQLGTVDEDTGDEYPTLNDITTWTGLSFPDCGTVACLAGHINLAAGVDPSEDVTSLHDGAALAALGLPDGTPAYRRLFTLFYTTNIRTYADLRAALEERFTFPESFPEPTGAPS
jgi:hypothetical protein